jgi:hypothetical protein
MSGAGRDGVETQKYFRPNHLVAGMCVGNGAWRAHTSNVRILSSRGARSGEERVTSELTWVVILHGPVLGVALWKACARDTVATHAAGRGGEVGGLGSRRLLSAQARAWASRSTSLPLRTDLRLAAGLEATAVGPPNQGADVLKATHLSFLEHQGGVRCDT